MRLKLRNKLLEDAFLLFFGNGVNAACQLTTTILLASTLPSDIWGGIAVIMSYVLVIETLLATKTWQLVSSHAFIHLSHSPKRFSAHFSNLFTIELATNFIASIFAVLMLPLAIATMNLPESFYWSGLIYCLSVAFRFSGSAGALLRLFDKYHWQSLHAASLGLTRLGVILAIITRTESPAIILGAIATVESIWHIALTACAWPELSKRGVKWQDMSKNLRRRLRHQNWKLISTTHLTALLKTGSRELDVLLISAFITPETAGVVKVYRTVLRSLLLVSDPLANATLPRFIKLYAEHAPIETLTALIRKMLVIGACLATLGLATLSTIILLTWKGVTKIPYPLNDGYFITYAAGIWVAVTFFCLAPANLAIKRYDFALRISAAIAMVYIITIVVLTPVLGSSGAGLAFFLSQFIWASCYYISFRKLENKSQHP